MANITIIEPLALLRLGLFQLISDLGTDIYLHSRDYPKPGDDPVMTSGTPPRWPPAINQSVPAPQVVKKEMTEHELLGLTPRQYEVLVLLARGYPMKTVGRCLNISVATAKAHTETLYQRLDVHNRNAAVYAAVSRGAKLGWECMGAQEDTVVKHHLR